MMEAVTGHAPTDCTDRLPTEECLKRGHDMYTPSLLEALQAVTVGNTPRPH